MQVQSEFHVKDLHDKLSKEGADRGVLPFDLNSSRPNPLDSVSPQQPSFPSNAGVIQQAQLSSNQALTERQSVIINLFVRYATNLTN